VKDQVEVHESGKEIEALIWYPPSAPMSRRNGEKVGESVPQRLRDEEILNQELNRNGGEATAGPANSGKKPESPNWRLRNQPFSTPTTPIM
jgi:hypothetical protein